MTDDICICKPIEVLFFPCSGGSNVGQIANEAAKQLTTQRIGKIYCLAGIAGHISGFAEATLQAKKVIAIDGCPVCCVKKTLAHAACPITDHVVVTQLGIQKTSDLTLAQKDIEKVKQAVKEIIKK